MSYAEFNAKSLRLSDSTNEVVLTSGTASLYNGTNRINITSTTFSSDAILTITNANLSGATSATMVSTDNSSKWATTAFVKAQVPNLTGYAQNTLTQSWTATQNFSTITASTPATSDNSSTVATTAFVKAQSGGLTLPIVLGTTGVLTTLGQTILYSTTPYNKTINSTERVYAPSGLLAAGTYIVQISLYANPATYTITGYYLGSSATQMTDNQTSGIDYNTYNLNEMSSGVEVNGPTITNGVISNNTGMVLNILSSRPYVAVISSMQGGTTNAANIQLKLTRLS